MDTQKVVAILERFLDPEGTGQTTPPESALLGTIDRLQRSLEATRARLAAQNERLARLREDLARVKLKPAPPQVRSISIPPPLPAVAISRPSAVPPIAIRTLARTAARAPRERFLVALAFALMTLVAVELREILPVRAQSVARLRAAVPTVAMTPPHGDSAVAEGLRLVFAYRPTAARVTVGEVLEPILGKILDASKWELTPIESSTFWIIFRPFTDDIGLSHQYRFHVDAAARRVRPTPETLALLRADIAGRLASLSDFKGLRQVLDLSGDNEVVVGQAADRMGR